MKAKLINEIDLKNKNVVIRVDMNVPIKEGKVTSDTRIKRALKTINYALDNNAAVLILSHLGRPTEGEYNAEFSLVPVAKRLSELLNKQVVFAEKIEDIKMQAGQVVMLDNIRFMVGEKKNSPELAQKLANLADVYCMDAFGAAHRAHASTEGAIRAAKVACAGFLMAAEMDAVDALMENPKQPFYAIIGGSKVSTKLTVLENLADKVDGLIVGGGIANTFLMAQGYNVGKSLAEPDLVPNAKTILAKAKDMPLPLDVVVAKEFKENAPSRVCAPSEVAEDEMILDVGPKTVEKYREILSKSKTIVWNGPVGAFETKPFDEGSKGIALFLAETSAYTLVCGGDSIAAVETFNVADKMDYISTGGGAFLEVLEGKTLPAIQALKDRA